LIIIETSHGTMKAELWAEAAPATVENFLGYVDDGFYDGTIFHRVMPTFMIQGGGFTPDMKEKATKAPIKNEARTDVKNVRGTLAMARTSEVDSATSQFFINVVDNGFLDHKDDTPQGFGYCVFGKVVDGLDVLDSIRQVATGSVGGHDDVPKEPVVMTSIRREG
jgi:peptidyl-prolyl cis-trans isomerase B (cyclophilin B)